MTRSCDARVVILILALLGAASAGCGAAVDEATERRSVSATRAPGESFSDVSRRLLPERPGKEDGDSAYVFDRRTAVASADLALAPEWTAEQLASGFVVARDLRSILWHIRVDFPRRPSFLYPDDGCFARAEMMGFRLAQAGYPRPGKLFIFGDLLVKTDNSPDGEVSWWYHVVPVVRVGQSAFVIDPAIEPTQPLALDAWVSRQTALDEARISACGPYAYGPSDRCAADPPEDLEGAALKDQDWYLDAEWDRQIELSRDPEQVLGDFPPWSIATTGQAGDAPGSPTGEGDAGSAAEAPPQQPSPQPPPQQPQQPSPQPPS